MNAEIKVYAKQPQDFFPKVEVAATFVNLLGKLLFLQCASHKVEVGLWGIPGGKLERDETPVNGAKRELFEETGLDISLSDFLALGALYINKPDIDYTYHLFSISLKALFSVRLSDEHLAYQWMTPSEAKNLRLMNGESQALDIYCQYEMNQ